MPELTQEAVDLVAVEFAEFITNPLLTPLERERGTEVLRALINIQARVAARIAKAAIKEEQAQRAAAEPAGTRARGRFLPGNRAAKKIKVHEFTMGTQLAQIVITGEE